MIDSLQRNGAAAVIDCPQLHVSLSTLLYHFCGRASQKGLFAFGINCLLFVALSFPLFKYSAMALFL